jgi:hypothetical protein
VAHRRKLKLTKAQELGGGLVELNHAGVVIANTLILLVERIGTRPFDPGVDGELRRQSPLRPTSAGEVLRESSDSRWGKDAEAICEPVVRPNMRFR